MSIDIHISNYEEYLYSYVDGELTPEEAVALELFLDQHPHLRAELDQLMATRLQPEAVVFSNKASLYKSSQAQEENFESQLLSYMDGELSPQAARDLESFMDAHPQLRQELAVWEKTRLEPDLSVRFENKSVLYRHTARTVRMRPAYWWAAAAMLAGALFLLRNSFTQDEAATPATTAANNQPAGPTAPAAPENKAGTQPVPENAASSPALAQNKTTGQAPAERENTAPPAASPVLAQASTDNTANTETTLNGTREAERAAIAADLSSIRTQAAPEPATRQAVNADLTTSVPKVKESETVLAMNNKPSIDIQAAATLATPPPAQEPGELIMSVTGNGLESRVLDKVTNVAKLFSRKRNK
ncbi:anti-sigma factor family protein [Chitinophaga sp. 22620]|uniref:anti-sigma factor family protein n=1 Tax=Chitinophaga sp. 22620 TaxID=3453952 RepID=UPI003F832C90